MFIIYRNFGIFGGKKWSRKEHKQCKKGGNYQHLNKMDILDNAVGNVKKVMV